MSTLEATPAQTERDVLLSIRRLKKYFPIKAGMFAPPIPLKAVDGVDLDIYRGETVGVVGESGCGKTTMGRTVIRLYRPTAGQILFNGRDISLVPEHDLKGYRRETAMIFQDPYASLNPRMTVSDIIGEALELDEHRSAHARIERVHELLRLVGLNPEHATRFPHEFSGGQRQRIGVARSLAVDPKFIICDEPISALDVSIQAQVVNLLEELQQRLNLTYMFIAHDLSMVKHISNRVAVMYLGRIVELAPAADIYANPLHPYTRALLSAIPIPDPYVEERRQRIILSGDPPSPINVPAGCRFRNRCPIARKECAEFDPKLEDVGGGHMVACPFFEG